MSEPSIYRFGGAQRFELEDDKEGFLSLESYVHQHGGQHPIRKILVANNGIAAVKGIRSIRRWCFETFADEKTITFVAMATPEDLAANAEYIRMADEFFKVPGGSNNNNYANVDLIAEVAERCGAQAVWAGWGHASEFPSLPERLAKSNIVWIGPPPSAMKDLGDKIASTILAQSANVACVPWSGSGVTVDYDKEGIPEQKFKDSCVTNASEAVIKAEEIGFPIMIKASEGGGGKGIRKVTCVAEVEAAFRQVQGETPGSPIFLMKLAANARHLEVQLLADEFGEAIAVMGRDCSIQRRHQKIIEEGPVLAASPETWHKMEQAAVRLAKTVGYVGAGTVEYLFMEDGSYAFLELNPRLQVEHPVTELISGVNLPAAQVQVAMGIPLCRIADIRRLFGHDPRGSSAIDFMHTRAVQQVGHVIACRITAENPDKNFQPTSGTIQELNFRSTPDVWGYFSVGPHGGVHEFADSQFGHLFAVGTSRNAARKNMIQALSELSIRGEIRTTVEYLRKILETKDFKENKVHTMWLERVMLDGISVHEKRTPTHLVVLMGVLWKAQQLAARRRVEYMDCLERGRILVAQSDHDALLHFDIPLIYDGMKYRVKVVRSGPTSFDMSLNGSEVSADVHTLPDKGLLVSLDGGAHLVYGFEEASGMRIILDGETCLFEEEYDPSRLRTPMAGKLVRFLVEEGTHLEQNEAFAEMEVMKMYIPLTCPESGVIHVEISEGAVLQAGDLVATLDLDDPARVKKADVCTTTFPAKGAPFEVGHKSNQQLRHAVERLHHLLDGYSLGENGLRDNLNTLMNCLRDPLLPALEFLDQLSSLTGRIPAELMEGMQSVAHRYMDAVGSHRFFWERPESFPVLHVRNLMEKAASRLDAQEKTTLSTHLKPIVSLLDLFKNGNHGYAVHVITNVFRVYSATEDQFSGRRPEVVISELRKGNRENLEDVFAVAVSHYQLEQRNALIVALLGVIEDKLIPLLDEFMPSLVHLAKLMGKDYDVVVLKVRQILMKSKAPTPKERRIAVQTILQTVHQLKHGNVMELSEGERVSRLSPLIDQSSQLEDILFDFISDPHNWITRGAALEVYIRRVFRAFQISSFRLDQDETYLRACWDYAMDARSASKRLDMDMDRIDSVSNLQNMATAHPVSHAVDHSADSSTSSRLSRSESVTDDCTMRHGEFAFFTDLDVLKKSFPWVLEQYNSRSTNMRQYAVHSLHLGICWEGASANDEDFSTTFRSLLRGHEERMLELGIRNVCFVVVPRTSYPLYYTYRQRLNYHEDSIIRHIEPPLAIHLELARLSNFDIRLSPTTNHMVHLFEARPKDPKHYASRRGKNPYDGRRFFARVIIRQANSIVATGRPMSKLDIDAFPEAEFAFVEALNALETAIAGDAARWRFNHIHISILVDVVIALEYFYTVVHNLAKRHADSVRRLNVSYVEIKMLVRSSHESASASPIRFVCENPTGHVLQVKCYSEVRDAVTNRHVFRFLPMADDDEPGPLDGKPVTDPYPAKLPFQRQKEIANACNTIYVHDFLILFEKSLDHMWKELRGKMPEVEIPRDAFTYQELVLNEDHTELVAVSRDAGKNDIGMVAWLLKLKTPEYPRGREVVLIANDIAHQAGSFGTVEDKLFNMASIYSRKRRIPRLYFTANSGARIGIAKEVQQYFRVAWIVGGKPGDFEYLYLSEEDYEKHGLDKSVQTELIEVDGEKRHKIVAVIGKENGLGVENLSGSGLIAGETSKAYSEVFTLSYVSARTVGIGAYLVRLGQRIIQKNSSPIILTGFNALNKLLGKNVYTSNMQLGGIDIMVPNGVTHMTAQTDMEGVRKCLEWLSFVPDVRTGIPCARPPHLLATVDPVDRPIGFVPPSDSYDPRHMLAGCVGENNQWISGFFDKDSYVECLEGWARTVVTGRARLGGLPVGVIAVETRSVETVIPADPAAPASKEMLLAQAGQVWYPDSAAKTAQAIKDMGAEDLPLMIFANWRGFSGGMRDMAAEILKFGSLIVDALRGYTQPIFVYIPPHGELRGGAWVVIDHTINEEYMEMYASESARGGVLEPEGTLDVKYRTPQIVATMHRLDPELRDLDRQLEELQKEETVHTVPHSNGLLHPTSHSSLEVSTEMTSPIATPIASPPPELVSEMTQEIMDRIKYRETKLKPIYHQVAAKFVDLHDTPGRMLAKGVIRKVVPWVGSRKHFYWRMRRRISVANAVKRIQKSSHGLTDDWKAARNMLVDMFCNDLGDRAKSMIEDDEAVVHWVDSHQDVIEACIQGNLRHGVKQHVRKLFEEDAGALVEGLEEILVDLQPEQLQALKDRLVNTS